MAAAGSADYDIVWAFNHRRFSDMSLIVATPGAYQHSSPPSATRLNEGMSSSRVVSKRMHSLCQHCYQHLLNQPLG
jgi:hypothetical protein